MSAAATRITCIDFGPERAEARDVSDLPGFLAAHRPDWTSVRWINVDGLGDTAAIEALAAKYRLHPLAIEDVLHVPQRPKVDLYRDDGEHQARILAIVRMLQAGREELESEQISIFLGHKTVLTFQEGPGDVWDDVRSRLKTKGSKTRENDASFLVYELLDAIVDDCFPLLERYGDEIEEIERRVLDKPERGAVRDIHRIKRDLLRIRQAIWPLREVIGKLQHEMHECLSDATRLYLRDVMDHAVQILDIVETYRETMGSLSDIYVNSVSLQLNEVIKVLTVISVVFMPLSFYTGLFGMNFEHLPWRDARWAFPGSVALCASISLGMLAWFKRRGWL